MMFCRKRQTVNATCVCVCVCVIMSVFLLPISIPANDPFVIAGYALNWK